MEVSKAIESRRAIKLYDAEHRMSEVEIEKLMSLAMLAPTAWNIQNWRFVLVRDPEQRKKIRAAAWDQAQVTDASLLVVLTADIKAWEKEPVRYWRNAPGLHPACYGAVLYRARANAARRRDSFMWDGCNDSDAGCTGHGISILSNGRI